MKTDIDSTLANIDQLPAQSKKSFARIGFLIFGIVVVLFLGYLGLVANKIGPFQNAADGGAFGDSFGALTALFNALAFAGLLLAVLLQRQDLELQRMELHETRAVLVEQQQQLESQAEATKKQVFESTLFRLIDALRTVVSTIQFTANNFRSSGTSAIHHLAIQLRDRDNQSLLNPEATPISAAKVFEEWSLTHHHALTQYFSLAAVVVQFIERSDRTDKIFYFDLFRATLSPGELFLLFHFGLNNHRVPSFKPIAEKYGLFEDLRLELYDIPAGRNIWYSARQVTR